MKSYDYAQRKGIEDISWERFGELYQAIVEWLGDKRIDIVIGIARAGLFPATAVACALRRELYPIRVTRRVNDIVQYQSPIWRVDVPSMVTGQRVAVIDEIVDSGETLALVASRALERGARPELRDSRKMIAWGGTGSTGGSTGGSSVGGTGLGGVDWKYSTSSLVVNRRILVSLTSKRCAWLKPCRKTVSWVICGSGQAAFVLLSPVIVIWLSLAVKRPL